MPKNINPITGGFDTCTVFNLVEAKDAPEFKRKEIFDKVFGAMEKLRVEDRKLRRAKWQNKWKHDYMIKCGGWGTNCRPTFKRRLNPYDMKFSTLICYWYDSDGSMSYNITFPIDTTNWLVGREKGVRTNYGS